MQAPRTLIGATAGATVAVLWLVFDAGAVAIVVALAVIGALIGMVIDRPDFFIGLLQRLQDR